MKLLLDDRNLIVGIGSTIEYGVWGNLDNVASWRIGKTFYMTDNNFKAIDLGVQEVPTYVKENEYYYIDGEFKLADECPNEYRDKISANAESIMVLEDALCETDSFNNDRITAIEDALCELSTLLA